MTRQKQTFPPDEQFTDLEAQLAGTLKPIRPSKDVIHRLRARIRIPSREELSRRLGDWRRLFFVLSGVMSGLLLLITLARALYYLTGRKA